MSQFNSKQIEHIRASLKGKVITANDSQYGQARTVFYGGIDRRPAIIVRAATASDIAAVISLAHETELELAVRSGGHSPAGHSVCEGGIMLDLSEMRGLEIDQEQRTAWAETGLTAGEYTQAAAIYGLATGFGDTGSVGIGGLTLGGGVGYLVRKYGLTIDDLLAAEIVTADGQIRHVDTDTHPDLFWAIRGGGGNFGVVTRFQFRLHEVSTVVGGMLILPATPDVIAGFIAEAAAAPEELSSIANIMTAPPMPFLPAEVHGKLIILVMLVCVGDTEAGERAVAPFRALAQPLADMIRPMPYPEIYPPDEEEYHPMGLARTMFLDRVDPSVAKTILDHIQASTAMMAVTQLRVLGGAMARVPVDATAFAHRHSRIMTNVAALYAHPEEKDVHEAWVSRFAAAIQQKDTGAYASFLGDEGETRVRAAYPGATWDRLAKIKAKYDPTNLFHLNQNIPPATNDR
ncbi:MAG: FAD-binding oxidoreductase [Anaerolineae bacterium]|nr:FAD-binding oxidoreductase [Anaerolineae bacterium]